MTKRFRSWYVIAIVGIPLLLARPALGQDVEDRDRWVGGDDLWSNDDGWVDNTDAPSGAPSPVNADRWALVQSGNVIVDANIGTSGLTLDGGAVQINNGASLEVGIVDSAFSVGQTEIGDSGTLRLLGDGKFTTGLDANNRGTIDFQSPTASLETGGNFSTSGTLQLNISGAGTSSIKVGGGAAIGGVISPVFDGVSPAFGDSFPFVGSASTIALNNPVVELPATVVLGRGLDVRVEQTADGAQLTFGNLPILQVNRDSGESKILNVVGGPVMITGYTIGSELGLLNRDGLAGLSSQGAAGWQAPNPQTTMMSEVNLTDAVTVAVDESISLGNAYNGGDTHPNDEDVTFQFSTPSGSVLNGLVEYVGPANDFVANINPETGEVSLSHLSKHLGPIEVTAYSITSASGSLNVEAWNSFVDSGEAGAGWVEANPKASALNELNLESSKVFESGTVISLGSIFNTTDGVRDIEVQYTTADALLSATVEYGEVPDVVISECDPTSQGDLDGNGTVEFADFLALSANFGNAVGSHTQGDIDCNGTVEFADFLELSANFGNAIGAGTAASVPEPNSAVLLGLGGLLLLGRRRR